MLCGGRTLLKEPRHIVLRAAYLPPLRVQLRLTRAATFRVAGADKRRSRHPYRGRAEQRALALFQLRARKVLWRADTQKNEDDVVAASPPQAPQVSSRGLLAISGFGRAAILLRDALELFDDSAGGIVKAALGVERDVTDRAPSAIRLGQDVDVGVAIQGLAILTATSE
jgi:hypothetical protein